MTKFEVCTTINKSVEIVTEALNNRDNFPYWQTDLERFEVVKGGPNQVGSVGRLHYCQKGQTYIMEDKLIYCEPGKKYISEVSGDALTARVETILKTKGDKTEITIKWEGKAKIILLKLLFPFIKGKMTKQAQKELDTFKQLVEERGANFINSKKKVHIS